MLQAESRIGPYIILRLIREGGQGRVYLGYDRRLKRQVAIKLHTLPQARPQRRQALAEARKAAAIVDSRVVRIYDLIESRGYLAIVMEYVPGCDLETLLRQARLSIPSVLRIGSDLAAALAAAAQGRVVHGDMKAGNVLVTREGRVKLADFGVARRLGVDAEAGGSPASLAPEQLQGKSADLRSDLFSLGCLLYRLLAGEHPFAREGNPDRGKILFGPPPSLDKLNPGGEALPAELATLLNELLQPDPDQRPRDTHRVRSLLRDAARAFPLSRADSLAQEAAPCFRAESAEDIPLHIPAELRLRGKSRLVRRGLELWLQRFKRLRLSTQLLIVVTVPLLCIISWDSLMAHQPKRVHFEYPEIQISEAPPYMAPPGTDWLMEAVRSGVATRIGPMHATGAVGSETFFVQLAKLAPHIVVNTSLRCSEVVCVLFISRRDGEGYRYEYTQIPPQVPRRDWEALVAEKASALFP